MSSNNTSDIVYQINQVLGVVNKMLSKLPKNTSQSTGVEGQNNQTSNTNQQNKQDSKQSKQANFDEDMLGKQFQDKLKEFQYSTIRTLQALNQYKQQIIWSLTSKFAQIGQQTPAQDKLLRQKAQLQRLKQIQNIL